MKNIKPFDLEAALKGEPVMLRDGSKAFVRHCEAEQKVDDGFRLWGVVVYEWSTCTVMTWSTQGCFDGGLGDNSLDIVGMYPTSKTRMVNGFEVPAPETEEPKGGDWYFSPRIGFYDEFCEKERWIAHSYDLLMLKRGLVFLNKEDAITNAKAMLGINPYEECEK